MTRVGGRRSQAGLAWPQFRLMSGSLLLAFGACLGSVGSANAVPVPPKQHTITFDATALEPPTFWQVPGVTPEIATNDPDSTDALRTEEKTELQLKPGNYWYGTWTFSFQFTVTQDGHVDYSKTLDQCIQGRGTQTLRVNCRRMYPYGGQPDY